MNFSSYEKRFGVTKFKFIETTRKSSSAIEASQVLGMPYKTYAKLAKLLGCFKENDPQLTLTPLDEILEGAHPSYSTNRLKQRLIESGIKAWKCENFMCGITEWHGEPITLELDHINGNNSDHRLENLRILCPNCHSQTPTYANKRRD